MRFASLDALRGIAALVVVIYHAAMTNFVLAHETYGFAEISNPLLHAIAYTPLRIFWSGTEAVWLFFLLSGFVLHRATLNINFAWRAYFPSRLLRLYGPVLCVVIASFIIWKLFPFTPDEKAKVLVPSVMENYGPLSALRDATLITGTSGQIGPLWSLQWEILFSIFLPLYLLANRYFPKTGLFIGICSFVAGETYGSELLIYMPLFYFGMFLSSTLENNPLTLKLQSYRRLKSVMITFLLLAISALLITIRWTIPNQLQFASDRTGINLQLISSTSACLGMAMLIVVFVSSTSLEGFVSTRPVKLLAKISFSLYLVHALVFNLLYDVMGPSVIAALMMVFCSFILAIIFYYYVESPIHQYSRKLSKTLSSLSDSYGIRN